jgi:hypothetical protein
MKKVLLVSISALLAVGFFALLVVADESIVRFKGGIGVIPISNVVTDGTITVNRNIVRGVNPAGQIWTIKKLEAQVETNGDIKVEGEGLVLAGGNSIGRATGQRVFATLICEAAAPFTERNTDPAGVPLSPNGDFRIDDVLTPLPLSSCDSPVLLIRNASNRAWFAAGIPELENND